MSEPWLLDYYEVETHIILSAMVFCVSVGCFVLFSFISFSTLKGMCIILTLIAGKFRKHMSGYSFVCQGSWHFQWCHTLSDGAKIFHFHLNSTSKHLDLPEQQIKKKKSANMRQVH